MRAQHNTPRTHLVMQLLADGPAHAPNADDMLLNLV
jgi:hypothetical protein